MKESWRLTNTLFLCKHLARALRGTAEADPSAGSLKGKVSKVSEMSSTALNCREISYKPVTLISFSSHFIPNGRIAAACLSITRCSVALETATV